MEYALRQPNGLVSLTLASTFQSRSMLDAERARQRNELPAEVLETLRVHEAAGTTDDPAYKQATRVYDLTYICRIDPWPECLDRALRHMPVGYADDDGWDIQPRLGEIQVPTLVTCGRYDGCPACAQIIHRGIPNSEFVLFEESSHYAHIEETERYLAVVDDFLTRVERQRGAQL
jgi:proline-specific peptidase